MTTKAPALPGMAPDDGSLAWLHAKGELNASIITAASDAFRDVQRLRPGLAGVKMAAVFAAGLPGGESVDGLVRCEPFPAAKLVVLIVARMDADAAPSELLLPTDPPPCVTGLGYAAVIRADAIRMVVADACLRLVCGDDRAGGALGGLLHEMKLTPELVTSAARKFSQMLGGSIFGAKLEQRL